MSRLYLAAEQLKLDELKLEDRIFAFIFSDRNLDNNLVESISSLLNAADIPDLL